ncbi:MAG: Mur ligase family protein [Candidatus Saccharibacteria bacterium]
MQNFTSLYNLRLPTVIVYMLQATEYQVAPYLAWLHRTNNFNRVMKRRTLHKTKAARLLLFGIRAGIGLQITLGLVMIYLGHWQQLTGGVYFGLAIIISYPLVWMYAAALPLLLGRRLIVIPRDQRLIAAADKIFAAHPGVKIAVAGSYGKTTMKELLATVLAEGKKVAATPANKNVSISHARFAARLAGDEEVLIIEYGEGAPGDVARFTRVTHPTDAIITGLAPAHLDRYKTLVAAGQDIFSVATGLAPAHVFVNHQTDVVDPYLQPGFILFDTHQALGWRVVGLKTSLDGTSFTLKKGAQSLPLHSGLVGQHQVSYLAFVAALSLKLGLTQPQVQAGIAKTKPFEHRMQPYPLSGAWIIDDTYNGNLEGIRAGTQLLSDLDARRKIYVTPGLVDQGEESQRVHLEVGKLIAAAQPDLVVLMQNSVTAAISAGLAAGHYAGKIQIEDKPLEFYINLKHFVAAGDLVVMQNDWTDNYA